jgi:tRNA nucleotidyltransferase (CCA-adding enzyme)
MLSPPAGVVQLASTLEGAGYETWCVGGAVRDAILGRRHLDWDLATAATPPQVRTVFGRVVPVGEEFGTLGVFDASGTMHEVTTFRHDVRTDGRHAEVRFGASLNEDLARRDFTINAIAYSPTRQVLHDPFGGRADLERGLVRAVGSPPDRMREDRLRALRALRFAGRFGFRIEPATWSAIVGSVRQLTRLSRERIQQELVKTMEQVEAPSASLRLWAESGALRVLLPMVASAEVDRLAAPDFVRPSDATPHPARAKRRTLLRLTALYSAVTPGAAVRELRDLRFSNRDQALIGERLRAVQALEPDVAAALRETMPADAALRRWAARAGRTVVADALRVAFAGLCAEPRQLASGAMVRARSLYRRAVRIAYRDPVTLDDLAVDGGDLMTDAGLATGPVVGRVLRALLDWVVEEPARNRRDALLAQARELAAGDVERT